ncbi:uroporphyrinogen-III synthase [Brevundimonas sp.]|uniref:uroporphyrinogen-III synthase n=1 Tax=Brevundimonas sp. TaxID=1871086 RepID=UPI003BAB496C
MIAPLLAIRPLPQPEPDLTGVTALAFTSPNGVAAFAALSPDRSHPVLAVGDATAAAAIDQGFTDVASAAGDLIALAGLIRAQNFPADAVVLNIGAREPAGDLAQAVGPAPTVRRLPVYEAMETDIPTPDACAAVLIHSPRAGRALAARLAATAGAPGLFCIAISEAAAAPLTARSVTAVHAAPHPDEDSLLGTLGKAVSPV